MEISLKKRIYTAGNGVETPACIEAGYNYMNKKELISVIIPTRNRVNLLKQAVDSVLTQTHENLELIIVDEASTDETREYLKTINDSRVHFIYHEEPKGGNTARNNGLAKAEGDFIAFLDDDDIWAKRKLQVQYNAMLEHDDVGMVSCNNLVINTDNDIVRQSSRGYNIKYNNKVALKKIMIGNFMGGASFPLIRRDCLEEVNGFQEHLKSAQETNLYLRIISNGHAVFMCGDPLLLYRVHSQNRITDSYKPKLKGLEQLYYYKKNYCFEDVSQDLIDKVTFEHLNKISKVYMQHKKYAQFIDVKEKIIEEDLVEKKNSYYFKIRFAVARNRFAHMYPGRKLKKAVQNTKTKKLNKEWSRYMEKEFIRHQ